MYFYNIPCTIDIDLLVADRKWDEIQSELAKHIDDAIIDDELRRRKYFENSQAIVAQDLDSEILTRELQMRGYTVFLNKEK